MRLRVTHSLPFVLSVALASAAFGAPKRDRSVEIYYPPGALGHGVRLKVAGVEAQLQKKTAFVWLSRGDSQVMKGSRAKLGFSSRNWKNVRLRLRPKLNGWVTLKRTALLSGPADVVFPLEELGKKETSTRYTVPSSYELEAFNVLYQTQLKLGHKADLVVRFRDQLKPKGDTEIKAHEKRYTIDFSQLRPTAVGHIAAMAVLTREGLVKDGNTFPAPTLLAGSMNSVSKAPLRTAMVYLYGRAATGSPPDRVTPKADSDSNRRPGNLVALLVDLADNRRDSDGAGRYDAIHVPKLRSRILKAYRGAAPSTASVATPFGTVVVPVPGSGNAIRGWHDLILRLSPESTPADGYAVLRLNGISRLEIVW